MQLSMHIFYIIFLLKLSLVNGLFQSLERKILAQELGHLSMSETVRHYGYPVECYTVKTEDGYLLKIYRIPYGRKCGPDPRGKTPVLFLHGFHASSLDFINTGPDNGLGFLLADDCFDVWLANGRGNFESNSHVNLSNTEQEFWDFSCHEKGKYDIPAYVDLIEKVTGEKQMHFIGYSLGTTTFFTYASLYPEKSTKTILSMHALSPVVYFTDLRSPVIKWFLEHDEPIKHMIKLGLVQFSPTNEIKSRFAQQACNSWIPEIKTLCTNLLFFLYDGYDMKGVNQTAITVLLGHYPAGAAAKELWHVAQTAESGHFRPFDYGIPENLIYYGRFKPPHYKIEKILVPIYLHCADNDLITSLQDVNLLHKKLPNSQIIKVDDPNFNHLDYLYHRNVNKLLNDGIRKILDEDTPCRKNLYWTVKKYFNKKPVNLDYVTICL